ncbi:hypothetical protein H0H93_005081 [Arthromyces matolae]|nr:hypothetical protein H0H93_005081 [Arthromyces matolae]
MKVSVVSFVVSTSLFLSALLSTAAPIPIRKSLLERDAPQALPFNEAGHKLSTRRVGVDVELQARSKKAKAPAISDANACACETDAAATQASATFGTQLRTWVTKQSNAPGGMTTIDATLEQASTKAGSSVLQQNIAFEAFVTAVNPEWKSPRIEAQEAGHPCMPAPGSRKRRR